MANRREKRKRRQRLRNPRNHKIRRLRITDGGDDIINSMPDEILHHILSFVPTKLAVRTCVLSKRWRQVWCGTPSLDIDARRHKAGQIKQDLISYTATNITSFKLRVGSDNSAAEVDTWLDFAISRNVQKLRELSLRYCELRDKSMDNILSGCPILESLTLSECRLLKRLDLSKSPSLRRLKIDRTIGPIVIVAPHIHYLSLTSSDEPYNFVDLSSLTEASLDIYIGKREAHLFQTMAIGMLAKSCNVERLTVGPTFLKILFLVELRGVPFPTIKVQTLIIKTKFVRSIIPGIARLLLNSPGLKTLKVDTMKLDLDKVDMDLNNYTDSQVLNSDQCWRSEYEVFPTSKNIYTVLCSNDATSKLLASFIEFVLRNSKTLERIVVWLGGIYSNNDEQWFEELLQMVATLSHHNNVSIVLKRNNYFKY